MRLARRLAIISISLALATDCRADVGDVLSFLARVPHGTHGVAVVVIVLAVMAVNYLANLLVIGWPAIHWGGAQRRQVLRGTVLLTILGQAADRAGAFLAGLLANRVGDLLHINSWETSLDAANLALSGLAVGALAYYFLSRRWKVGKSTSLRIAAAAAVLTNPAWVIWLLSVHVMD